MQNTAVILIFLLIIGMQFFIAFGILLPIYKHNRHVSAGIRNHDWQHRKYVFKASMPKNQVLQTLGTHCEIDTLSCSVNSAEAIIRFEWYHDSKEYFFVIQETDCESLILLKAVQRIGGRSMVPELLNPFMVEKLNATLLPYSEYEDAFWD